MGRKQDSMEGEGGLCWSQTSQLPGALIWPQEALEPKWFFDIVPV